MDDVDESHIESTPPEVLSLIFVNCLGLARRSNYNGYRNQRCLPLTLACVSQFWRQVACTTPELWETCWLSYTHPELNTLWLSRAGTHMLEIDGSIIPDVPRASCPLNPFLSSIAPFANRLRTFSIHDAPLSAEDLDTCAFHAPNLVSCQILRSHPPLWLRRFFYRAPKLRRLRLVSFLDGFDAMFNNLRELQIRYLDNPEELRRTLINAPNLHSLSFAYYLSTRESSNFHGNTTHESLVHLELSCEYVKQMLDVLSMLTFPSLQVLSLHNTYVHIGENEELDVLDVDGFFQRSQCRIRELSIKSNKMLGILKHQAFSSLEVLNLTHLGIPDSFLLFLHESTNLPRLRRLQLEELSIYRHFNLKLLSDVISVRSVAVGPYRVKLEYLRLSFDINYLYGCNCAPLPHGDDVGRIKAVAKSSSEDGIPFVVDIDELLLEWDDLQPDEVKRKTNKEGSSDEEEKSGGASAGCTLARDLGIFN